MDTRKLKASLGVNGQGNIYLEGRGIMASMEAGHEKTRHEDAAELVKRWNRYPLLVDFIQRCGATKTADELHDFFVNNIDDVMEDEEGNDIDPDPYVDTGA